MSWRKSSYSNSDGGECVEVSDELVDAHQWRKSSYSNQDGGACLEVADEPAAALVPVRDSKNPLGPVLAFRAPGWATFVRAIKEGALGV